MMVSVPENKPSCESMPMLRNVIPVSLEMMEVMFVTIPMSSCPTTRSVMGYWVPWDLPAQRAFTIRYPKRSRRSLAFGQSQRCILIPPLTVTKPNGILENKVIYQILDKLVSLFRSIPFIILLTWVMPITRALVGTVLYVRGAIVPLVFGSVPFFTRQVESALAELDGGLIEAALSMGSSPLEIISRGTTITIVSLLNLTAMAGVAGAGGLGDFAIRYGHDRNMADITNVTVLVLVLIVCVIEFVGGRIVKKNTH